MKKLLFLTLILFVTLSVSAQDNFADRYNEFKKESTKKHTDFRKQANEKYAEFMKYAWEEVESQKPVPKPQEKHIAPVIYNEDEAEEGTVMKSEKATAIINTDNPSMPSNTIIITKPQEYTVVVLSVVGDTIAVVPADAKPDPQLKTSTTTDEETPIPIEEIITLPEPQPQPEPIEPIEIDSLVKDTIEKVSFLYYDTRIDVSKGEKPFRILDLSDNELTEAWKWLSNGYYDAFIYDCLQYRAQLHLSDWAYFLFVNEASQKVIQNEDAATFLMAYTITQSGYEVRLAINAQEKLRMLFGSNYHIYDRSYWILNNKTFYLIQNETGRLRICNLVFDQEKPVSLMPDQAFVLKEDPNEPRRLETTDRVAMVSASVSTDMHRIQFFANYPNSYYGDNELTRWAIYAAAPLSETARRSLYPTLMEAMKDKTERQQLNLLLRWVQKSLDYQYDNIVWGEDRAFFAEETLYYPYADCEDRSILFARLVRDLMNLRVALVYYPGHLATAVETTGEMMGDYFIINDSRFIVCDPTFINAPVGRTMSGCDNATAKVLIL